MSGAGRLHLLASFAAFLVAGCAVNPVSGRREVVLMSEEDERAAGREEAKSVAATMGLVEDGRIDVYVAAVGRRLAEGSARPGITYTFHVADAEEPNAFALPSGDVYVTRGLLVLMNAEAELAGVMGHEIGHVEARHAVQRITRAAPIAVVSGIGAAVTGIVSPLLGDIVGGAGAATNALLTAPYSRAQESEADRVGTDLAARAGWDPVGLAAALQALEREEALAGEKPDRFSFFATHPPLPNRVLDVSTEAARLQRSKRPPIAGSQAAFLARLDGLVVGASAAEGIVSGRTFLHPDLDVALVLPEGWKTSNGRTALASREPDGRAMVVLEVVGKGSDPAEGVAAFERETKSSVGAERLTVSGLPAMHALARARADRQVLGLDITWVAHRGTLFRIMGAAGAGDFDAFAATFRRTAAAFRPLTAAERAGIRETRLRVAKAERGETVAQLADRTGTAWKPAMVAAVNALDAAKPLAAGELVKIAVSEPYRGGAQR